MGEEHHRRLGEHGLDASIGPAILNIPSTAATSMIDNRWLDFSCTKVQNDEGVRE